MRRLLHISLILVLMLTGIALGSARGTIQIGGQMVLCTAQGIVVVPHPADDPEQAAHICPDMALSLMLQATSPVATAQPDAQAAQPADWRMATLRPVSRDVITARVRDPPIDVSDPLA